MFSSSVLQSLSPTPTSNPILTSENNFVPAKFSSGKEEEAHPDELVFASLQKGRDQVFEALRERRNMVMPYLNLDGNSFLTM